jgi:hypothetical protein
VEKNSRKRAQRTQKKGEISRKAKKDEPTRIRAAAKEAENRKTELAETATQLLNYYLTESGSFPTGKGWNFLSACHFAAWSRSFSTPVIAFPT